MLYFYFSIYINSKFKLISEDTANKEDTQRKKEDTQRNKEDTQRNKEGSTLSKV